ELAEAVVVQIAVAVNPVGIVVVHLVAHIATDAQAGLGARDVEETSAVHVADANVFHRLRLGDDDRISCASAGCSDSSHCGAEKHALHVHFLPSSQKLQRGSGYLLLMASVPCYIPNPQKRRDSMPPLRA